MSLVEGKGNAQYIVDMAEGIVPGPHIVPTPLEDGISKIFARTRLGFGHIAPYQSHKAKQRSRLARIAGQAGGRVGGPASQDAARTAGEAQGHTHARMIANRFVGGTDSNVKTEKETKTGLSAYGRGGKAVLQYDKAVKDGAPAEKLADLKRKADDASRESKKKKSKFHAGGAKLGTDHGGHAKSGHQVTIKLIVDGVEVPLKKVTHTVKAASSGNGATKVGEHNALTYTSCSAKVRDAIMVAKGWGDDLALFKAHFHPNAVSPPVLGKLSGQHGVMIELVKFK